MATKGASGAGGANERWWPWLCRGGAALVIATVVLTAVYMHFLSREHQRLSLEQSRTGLELQKIQKQSSTAELIYAGRMDYIERVLFGEVVTKIDKSPRVAAARIEKWEKNRDRELRDRLSNVEQRLYRIETVLDRLEKAK